VDAYSISKCKEITLKAPQAKQEDNAVPKSSELLGQLQRRDCPKNLIRFVRGVWTINALMATVRSVQETYVFRIQIPQGYRIEILSEFAPSVVEDDASRHGCCQPGFFSL
jgi:hypothetical protein